MQFFFQFLMWATSGFLILLVLIQRGRGGGLAGALGGMGGQSAFGAKAGDLFTRITIGVAAFWILLYIVALKVLQAQPTLLAPSGTAEQGSTGLETLGDDTKTVKKDADSPEDKAGAKDGGTTSNPKAEQGGDSAAEDSGTVPKANSESAAPGGGAAPASDSPPSEPPKTSDDNR